MFHVTRIGKAPVAETLVLESFGGGRGVLPLLFFPIPAILPLLHPQGYRSSPGRTILGWVIAWVAPLLLQSLGLSF